MRQPLLPCQSTPPQAVAALAPPEAHPAPAPSWEPYVLDALAAHIAVLDQTGRIIAVNAAWRRFARANGLPYPDHGVGLSYLEVCAQARGPEGDAAVAAAQGICAVLRGQCALFTLEYPCHSADTQRWFTMRVTPCAPGHRARAVVAHEDITARKQAEEALQAREAQTQAIIQTAVDGILTITEQGIIESLNPAAERLFGYRAAEAIGQNVTLLMPPSDRDAHDSYLERYCRTGEKHIIGIGRDVIAQRRDGTTFPINLAVGEAWIQGRRFFTGIVRDITARKRAEEELQRASHLALLGQLASGVAHEIGTPLNVMTGNAELLRSTLCERHLPTTEVDTIIEQGDRITRLIEQLLALGRVDSPLHDLFVLAEPLTRALRLLETRFGREAITVVSEIPADLLMLGSADQMEQVFLNLLVNAWHAMPTGGTLTIRAWQTGANNMRITLRDTGIGMSAEQVARAFEPFYSTKGKQGNGLGLAMCHQIIAHHQGTIRLESALGEGTTVVIDVPIAAASDAAT